jgi:hypothetical protein
MVMPIPPGSEEPTPAPADLEPISSIRKPTWRQNRWPALVRLAGLLRHSSPC